MTKREKWVKETHAALAQASLQGCGDDFRAKLISVLRQYVLGRIPESGSRTIQSLADEVWIDWHYEFGELFRFLTKCVLTQLLIADVLPLMEWEREVSCERAQWLGAIEKVFRYGPNWPHKRPRQESEVVSRTILPLIHVSGTPDALAAYEHALSELLRSPGLNTADDFLEAADLVKEVEVEPKSRPLTRPSREDE